MANELISTALLDDPDPEGTDVYGILPLIAEIPEDSEDDESMMGADDDDEEALLEPTSLQIKIPEGDELPDDDDDAYEALTADGDTDLAPGEAEDLIEYMRPLSEDEREFIETTPFVNDLRWVDDPAHIADVLKAGKDGRGMDTFLRDASYGDVMNEEELANLNDTDKFRGWKNMGLEPRQTRQLVKVAKPIPMSVRIQHGKRALVSELQKKMTVEHANWLADQDKAQGIPVRPRAYYENVARLWTASKLKGTEIPVSSSGNWSVSPRTMLGKANEILAATEKERSRFSFALGLDDSLGGWGWNPIKSLKSAVRSVGRGVKKGASFGYRMAKKTALAPITYTYKGIKYIGDKALQLALRPIKAIIGRYTKTMVSRRANALAKQRGLKVPGVAERSEASSWAKQLVRSKGGKYGGAIASLMGAEYGLHKVDISLGEATVSPQDMETARRNLETLRATKWKRPYPIRADKAMYDKKIAEMDPIGQAITKQLIAEGKLVLATKGPRFGLDPKSSFEVLLSSGALSDEMGLSKAAATGLILLGPIGLIAILTGLVKLSSPAAPPPEPGSEQAAEEAADAQAADEGTQDEGQVSTESPDAGAPADEAPADASGASWLNQLKRLKRRNITLEQLNRMGTKRRAFMQKLIQSGRIRLV